MTPRSTSKRRRKCSPLLRPDRDQGLPQIRGLGGGPQGHHPQAFATHADVPVINMETITHPCQELVIGASRAPGTTRGQAVPVDLELSPQAPEHAVANSAPDRSQVRMNVTLLCPTEDYLLDDRYMNIATRDAGANGGSVTVTHDIETGYEGADVVYGKSWGLSFFGRWEEEKPIRDKYQDFIVDSRKMAITSDGRQPPSSDETQRHHDRRSLRRPELHRLRRGGEPSPCAEGDHDHPDRPMSEDRVPASPNRDVRQTIVHLLSNMSDGREIRSYLQRFSEGLLCLPIKIGGAILAEQPEETAAALAFLHTVGLTPIVIHGGGTQLDRALDERGIESRRIDGLRVTEPDVLDAARDTFIEQNILLVEAIREQGVAAHGLTAGAFEAGYVDREKYGLVGEPTEVHIALIRSIVDSGPSPSSPVSASPQVGRSST